MKAKYLLYAAVAMFLWASCTKKGTDDVAVPAPVPVPLDTVALLTGCQWNFFAIGTDADADLMMDGGSLIPYTTGGLKLYTFNRDGVLWDSSFLGGAITNIVQLSWEFGDNKSKLAFYLGPKQDSNVNVFVMANFSDTTMVLRPLLNVTQSWRLFKKYVRK